MNHATPSREAILLPFLGVLCLRGPDAGAFLQGQVTHDTSLLADGRTLLAACNTPQGRVVALLRLRQAAGAIHALLPVDLLEPLAARLRRYVMRAKVEIQIADGLRVAWLQGGTMPATSAAARAAAELDPAAPISFDYAPGRRLLVATESRLQASCGPALAQERSGLADDWWAADVAAGLPQVFRASSESFVPQMLNLDLLDGISFTKGCYTGQEIVARTQNLGRIKRRTLRYRLPGGPLPDLLTPLYRDGTKVAEVVLGAARTEAVELLAVTQLDAGDLPLALEDGRIALPQPLPYVVPGTAG